MEDGTRCENCGSNIEKDYILFINGAEFFFDSFECAVNFVAPRCAHCNTVILGKSFQSGDQVFCTENCSKDVVYASIMP